MSFDKITAALLLSTAILLPRALAVAQPAADSSADRVPANFAADGIARANYYRAMAKLPPLVEDSMMSAGALNHARYLVKHGIVDGDIVLKDRKIRVQLPQDASKWEVKGKSFYTDDGATVGRRSIVVTAVQIDLSGPEFVDRIMAMPFSGLTLMVPQFSKLGVGAYCEPGQCAVVIPFRYALEKAVRRALYDGPASDLTWNPNLGPIPGEVGRLRSPVEFPPDNAVIDLATYDGGDLPNPLSACPGYVAPTGTPITFQLGEGYGADGRLEISEHSVSRDGVEVEHCVITAASYAGRNKDETELGRDGLVNAGAAVVLPRQPLKPGHYNVALTEGSKRYDWNFTISQSKPASTTAR
jgi:hypothetical protein